MSPVCRSVAMRETRDAGIKREKMASNCADRARISLISARKRDDGISSQTVISQCDPKAS